MLRAHVALFFWVAQGVIAPSWEVGRVFSTHVRPPPLRHGRILLLLPPSCSGVWLALQRESGIRVRETTGRGLGNGGGARVSVGQCEVVQIEWVEGWGDPPGDLEAGRFVLQASQDGVVIREL